MMKKTSIKVELDTDDHNSRNRIDSVQFSHIKLSVIKTGKNRSRSIKDNKNFSKNWKIHYGTSN